MFLILVIINIKFMMKRTLFMKKGLKNRMLQK